MTKPEIQAELDKAKRQLKSAEEYNIPAAIEKAKTKISDLEAKLAASEDMKEGKKEPEKKKEAVVKKAKKAKKEPVKKQEAGKGIKHIDKSKIQKNPKLYITRIEKVEMYANKLASSFRDLLGDDFKSTQMKKEMNDIEKAIKEFVAKFKKEIKK